MSSFKNTYNHYGYRHCIYKAYEYFAKDDKLEDFEEDEDEIAFEGDKPLKNKIKDVAKKVIH